MEPLTEHRPVHGPVVYGYLHLPKASAARQIALTESLAEYCRRHELLLCEVFTERSRITASRSPSFTGLLDVLGMPDTYGVVLPAISHLGTNAVADELQKQITATGTRLLLVRGAGSQQRAGLRPSAHHSLDPAPTLDAKT
jgi:hypothetical protein